MSKRLAVTSLVILLASFICSVAVPVGKAQASTMTVYVDPLKVENVSLIVGTIFNVSVKVDNIPDNTSGAVGVQFLLTWNSSVLNAVSMEEVFFHSTMPTSELSNLNMLANDVEASNVSYAYTYLNIRKAITNGYAPVSGNHTIANIAFKVVGVGKCALHIDPDNTVLGDQDANSIPFDALDGSFSNLAPPPPPKAALLYVYPAKISDSSLTPGQNFTLNINIINASGLSGLEFELGFNASVLHANSVAAGSFIPSSVSPVTQIDNTAGFVKFNVSLSTPLSGDGNVTVVQFQVQAPKVRNSTLHLYDVKLVDSTGQALASNTADGSFSNVSKVLGDLNGDGVVNIQDAILAGNVFGLSSEDLNYNPDADLYPVGHPDGQINIMDMIVLASYFHM